jgi:hypothetical protein
LFSDVKKKLENLFWRRQDIKNQLEYLFLRITKEINDTIEASIYKRIRHGSGIKGENFKKHQKKQ